MRFQPFFEDVYVHLCDGTCLLHPAVHASINMPTYSVLGGIISHAHLVAGVFPGEVATKPSNNPQKRNVIKTPA